MEAIDFVDFIFDRYSYDENFDEGLPLFEDDVTVNYPCIQIKWHVANLSEVSKGQLVCSVVRVPFAVSKKEYYLYSPISGIICINITKKDFYYLLEFNAYKLFSVYKDANYMLNNRFAVFNKDIEIDDFDNTISLKWNCVANREITDNEFPILQFVPNYYNCYEMLSDSGLSLFVSFQIKKSVPYIVFSFREKDMRLTEGDFIDLLLDIGGTDNKVLSFQIGRNVIHENYENLYDISYYCEINKDDIGILADYDCLKWRIRLSKQLLRKIQGNNYNLWCQENFSCKVFKLYAEAFLRVINEIENQLKIDINFPRINYKNEESGSCYVYLMHDLSNGYYKIGISNKPEYRERTLQSEKPTIELLCAKVFPNRALACALESALHRVYKDKRIRGEWFVLEESDIIDLFEVLK